MVYRVLILIFFIFSFVNTFSFDSKKHESLKFTTRNLESIAGNLKLDCEFPRSDTIIVSPNILKNKGIVFRFNKNGDVNHIGVSLFSEETKQLMDIGICNFLERLLLQLVLINDNDDVERKLNEFKILMYVNGKQFSKKTNYSISDYIESMDMPVNFSLKCEEKTANAVWIYNSNTFNICFPLYRELIDGSDKKESDEILYNDLYNARLESIKPIDDEVSLENLEEFKDGIYVRKGTVFLIPDLTSNVYYVEKGKSFEPLYSLEYPEISMNNLFLTDIHGEGKILALTHRSYGYFTPELTMPLLNFLNFFKDDFETLCHTRYNKKGNLETIIVLNHKKLNYIHLLRVVSDKESLFSSNTVFKADFYSNIPQHYIKTLLK